MSNIVRLRQPFRKQIAKRLRALLKMAPRDRLGWLAVVMVAVAMMDEARGNLGHANYILCLAIILLMLAKDR